MKHIFGNLLRHKAAVCAIILLLITQAYCDLALPTYTSDIVDVGLQQYGIEDCVMTQMRESTGKALQDMLPDEGRAAFADAYVLNDTTGNYELQSITKEQRSALGEQLQQPLVLMYAASHMDELQEQTGMDASMLQAVSRDSDAMQQMLSQYGDMSDSIMEQIAVQSVTEEYEACGIDLNALQRQYLLTTGAKMMALSLLMLAAAVLCGYLSAKTAARIGMELRSSVFRNVLSFSSVEMNRFSTASLITRSTNDIQQIQMVTVMLLRMVFYAPVLGIGAILKVVTTKTGMGWIIVLAVVIISGLVLVLMGVTLPKFKMMQKLVDRLNLVSREILTGLPVIRAFSREKFEEDRFDKANRDLMGTQLFTNHVMTLMMPAMMMLMNGVTVLIVWMGGKGIDMGNLQVGDMIAFISA